MLDRHYKLTITLIMLIFISGTSYAQQVVRIGIVNFMDAEITAETLKQVFAERLNLSSDVKQFPDLTLLYQALARGEVDIVTCGWLPLHQPYMDKAGGSFEKLGVIYENAQLGWMVPAYVPENQLKSFADLVKPEVRSKLNSKIYGINPGSGTMLLSEQAMEIYGLDRYRLIASDDKGMTAALERAINQNDWVVVTGRRPHLIFARWQLRVLDDPQKAMGGPQKVYALGRQGFQKDFPKAATVASNYRIALNDLEMLMLKAQQSTAKAAVSAYLKSGEAVVGR